MLLAKGNAEMTYLHEAAYMGKLYVLLQVLDWAEGKLTIEDINRKTLLFTDNAGMRALHNAACAGKLDVLLKIWKWAEEKLTAEGISNKLFLATNKNVI